MRVHTRGTFLITTVLVVAGMPGLTAAEPSEPSAASSCANPETLHGVGPVCRLPNGLYEVFAPDGSHLGYIHGTDPRGHDEGPITPAAGTSPHCVAGSAGEYFVHVIYARAHDDTDRYSTMAPTIRTLVGNSNKMIDDAAIATGDTASIKVKCSGGVVVVANAVLPTARTSASFSTIVNDLRAMGYNDFRQKYWVYYDDASACSCAGTGHLYNDDSNNVNNFNNGNSAAVPMFAVSFDSNSVRTMLHELGHTLGAVQNSAPFSTGAGHCTDGKDTMCYNDGGPSSGGCTPDFHCSNTCATEVFDCGKNTYFHANPTAGSYLATHWQVGSRLSRYIVYGGNAAPVMASLSCSPNPSSPGATVTCSFSATDDSTGVYYTVSWGDGTPNTRVPSSGTVAPGTTQTATHAWSSAGSYSVSVTATDNAATPLTSPAMTVTQTVTAPNAAPVMASLSCSPNPSAPGQTVTCSFHATDDSTGVYYTVVWGDGTPNTRVPSSGTVAPGTTRTATHAWASPGSYTVSVTATDNAPTPLTSPPRTATQTVTNAAPTMTSLSCSPNPSVTGQTVTCTFSATDDSSGVYYTLAWGDGTPNTRVPASGTVAPGTTQSATHAWSGPGGYTVSVTATDNAPTPLTSSPRTTTQTVNVANGAPTMNALSCSPNPSEIAQSVTCSFSASDSTSSGVYYTVDWGDGTPTTRVPSSGHAAPGTTQTATHAWSSAGTKTVSVTATDNGAPPLTSSALTASQTVNPGNAVPVMAALTCSPNPSTPSQTVVCSFHATDDSGGVHYTVLWGDGSPAQRVPASGHVAPGSTVTATHAWSAVGSYTVSVTATDDGTPVRTSAALTRTQTVQPPPNAAPVMAALACTPTSASTGALVTCTFHATDDGTGVFYVVDWADGTTTRVPASGTMSPGTTASASHAWSTTGPKLVSVSATDNGAPPITSAPRTTTVTITTPPCSLSRSNTLVLGLAGQDIDGVSARSEFNVPTSCQGRLFQLTGSAGSDFNVCWRGSAGQTVGCFSRIGNESGTIPAGAVSARIVLFAGANASYQLTAS